MGVRLSLLPLKENQMITKKIVDNQLFVFYNGSLIYKKWLKLGYSAVFEKHGPPTYSYERNGK